MPFSTYDYPEFRMENQDKLTACILLIKGNAALYVPAKMEVWISKPEITSVHAPNAISSPGCSIGF